MEFKIDGIPMPKPSSFLVNIKPISCREDKIAGTGEKVKVYLRTIYEIVWEYKFISEEDFDILYNAYINSTVENKSFYKTIITPDSNSDKNLTLEVCTQDNFSAPLYRIKNGKRYYKDVRLVFESR